MTCVDFVIPAKGRPAKYHFAGTPKAGINSGYRVGSVNDLRQFIPASAGVTEKGR